MRAQLESRREFTSSWFSTPARSPPSVVDVLDCVVPLVNPCVSRAVGGVDVVGRDVLVGVSAFCFADRVLLSGRAVRDISKLFCREWSLAPVPVSTGYSLPFVLLTCVH